MADAAAGERALDPVLDPWGALRGLTRARIGLSRTGDTLSGAEVRAQQIAHAQARRAVHARLDAEALGLGVPYIEVCSRAPDRATFVRSPDLGRRLTPQSAALLQPGAFDIAFVIADGLSAIAAERQAPPLLRAVMAALPDWSTAPPVVAHNSRVALGDEIGGLLGAQCVVMMIGERPGLSVSDSLSLYITWAPHVGRSDAERNCISNIHAHGLSIDVACMKLCWILRRARRIGQTGVVLKDESASLPTLPTSGISL